MKNRNKWIAGGVVAGMGVGLFAYSLRGESGTNEAEQNPNASTPPAASASGFLDRETGASASPSVATSAGTVCTRVIAELPPREEQEEGADYMPVRLRPNLQPAPNKGPADISVEYTPVDQNGYLAGDPEVTQGQDQVDVPFYSYSQAGRVAMTVTINSVTVSCPTALVEVNPPEDGNTPVVTVSEFPGSGAANVHPDPSLMPNGPQPAPSAS